MSSDSTTRFSDRVENYVKYRPGYPDDIIALLKKEGVLKSDSVVADIGSGTGISAEMFLKNGNKVYGVEPNKEMREACERLLSGYISFISVSGTAENTALKDNSVDLIVSAQAFHWFDTANAKAEFRKILKPAGWVVLIWNQRKTDTTPFLREYEKLLLRYGTDYEKVRHENITEDIIEKFFGGDYKYCAFENYQVFDLQGVKGRLFSSSYVPSEESSAGQKLSAGLAEIFSRCSANGNIRFEYETNLYYGVLSP